MSNRDMPTPPSHKAGVEEKPKAPAPGTPSNVKEVKNLSEGIEVVALRKGHYKTSRKKQGDKFLISSLSEAGEWMKCTNPEAEKEHQELLKKRKEKLKALKAEKSAK